MAQKKAEQELDKDTGMPTEVLDFGDRWGKWKVRGLLAEEDFKAQDECMTIDATTGKQAIDSVAMRINMIKLGTLESPDGPHPPTNMIRRIPSGMASKILASIKKLSTPGGEAEKN